jgi:DivIVA domain-containing protein
MGQLLLILAVALVVGVIVFGVAVLVTGSDSGLEPAEPDGSAVPLPTHRPLAESDVSRVRFDLALRGYRMAQVDQALRRTAYDIGYKDELISVLEAEVEALRAGRTEDAEAMRRAREAALSGANPEPATLSPRTIEPVTTLSGAVVPVIPPAETPTAETDAVDEAEAPAAETEPDIEPGTEPDTEPGPEADTEEDSDAPAASDPVPGPRR